MGSTTTRLGLFFDRQEVSDFAALLARFGPGALASPYRSTVPLLSLVKDAPAVFSSALEACGCAEPSSVHFEYQVTVPGVEGNPSQTDAMVVSSAMTVALEAKWTEPRYETVDRRLKSRVAALTRKDPSNAAKHDETQRAVIAGWLRLLGRHSKAPLGLAQAGEAVYQMIHRAASACHMPGACALAYMHFEPSPAPGAADDSIYRADLEHLHELLGSPRDFPFFLVSVPLRPTDAFDAIKDLPKRDRATDQAVRAAIERTRLFQFKTPRIERIG